MSKYSKYNIADGVSLISVNTDRFKDNQIAITFAVDLCKETTSRNALAVSMITNCSNEYPDITSLSKKLGLLYGASITSAVTKIGEAQVLNVYLSFLDDRFSLDEKISSQCIDLLLSLLFNPRLDENGNFYEEDIQREKRTLIEKIESEFNEKRIYALRKAESIMFEDEPYAVNCYGCAEDVEKISSNDIKEALDELICNSKIQIEVIGNADINSINEKLTNAFSKVNRKYKPLSEPVIVRQAGEVKDISERMDVKQGKLVLGYRVNLEPNDERYLAVRSFCDAFGGGPYSKLFANVREKLSLCYYCSAKYVRQKSCILIQCGCEEQNMDRAIEEINNQLEQIIKGNFEEEYNSSKIGLTDAILSQNDDSVALCLWYANQIPNRQIMSPDESAQYNNQISFDEVQESARLLSLDTIYRLLSK